MKRDYTSEFLLWRLVKKARGAPLAEQTIKLGFDDLIAFAACRLQSLTVEDRYVAADVTNQTGLLQALGRLGDALAASSQHVGDELLGEQQFLQPHPVVGEQQPAAESLLDRVKAVADSGLGYLSDQRLRVAQQQELTRTAPPELFKQNRRRHAEGVARDLRHRTIRHCIATHKEGDPNDAVVTHQAHLGGRAVGHGV